MKKQLNLLWKLGKKYSRLASVNRQAIRTYNEKILSALTLMGALLIVPPLLIMPFSETKIGPMPVYLLATLLFFSLFLLFRFSFMKKYVLGGLYTCFSIFFLLAIYLSVIYSPNMRATILLGAFCIMPLGFIDRPARMNMFEVFWFIVHTILAFYLKPEYAMDDTINSMCFVFFGCFLGNMMVCARLDGYEVHRSLTIEKDTDVLTNLFNRRKLFETLADLETTDAEKPSGILMVDIDHFKNINDRFGHVSGDKLLSDLGEVLTKFAQNLRICFYRYGGEEFVAMAYGYDEKELFSIAENLRVSIQSVNIEEYFLTASIGVAYCGDEHVQNYENIIDRADRAAYLAKRAGRNNVYMYKN